jgi:hypothetical protein
MRLCVTAALCCGALLVASAPAQAAKGTYAGTVPNTTGKVAFDVKISKKGIVKKITELRGKSIPSTCEVSGPVPSVNYTLPTVLRVDAVTGKFSGEFTQPTYGNVSSISGKIKHKNISGTIQVNYHYQAEGQYPEENCDTGPLPFKARLGNPDETITTPPARPNWR